ncbi:MAG TPA: hypothetical protein VK588_07590 [Chitinophagaceae bacterium]|nr:hypothetical protein [Chitinophagaceae bacterium]
MTTISKEANFLTLINVFTVEPINQQKLVDLLTLATGSTVRKAAGFNGTKYTTPLPMKLRFTFIETISFSNSQLVSKQLSKWSRLLVYINKNPFPN